MPDDDKLPSLEDLGKAIDEAKKRSSDDNNKENRSSGALSVGIDLVSGVAVGSFAGYYLDKWLGTLPLFFIICFFLGVAGSWLNIYRNVQRNSLDNDKKD